MMSGLQRLAELRQLDEQARLGHAVDREVKRAVDTTVFAGAGLLPLERQPTLESTEREQRNAGLAFVAVGLGLGGLYLVTRRR